MSSARRIGSGYYYNVFDIGNGRVRKVRKPFFERLVHIAGFEKTPRRILKHMRLTGQTAKLRQEYERLLATVDPALLGNPKLLPSLAYEQDRVTVVYEAMASVSEEGARQIIDQYIDLIVRFWEYGFADRVYNFTINNGITEKGKLILLDFNEVTFKKEDVARSIETKRWKRAWSCTSLPVPYRRYYEQRMDEVMTEENLDRHWGITLASSPKP